MSKPRLLDLFCKAGGCAMGYYRARFEVTGIDIEPQPRFPFAFVQADAFDYLRYHGHEYDVIHASPPCQAYSVTRSLSKRKYPDLVAKTRDMLMASGKIWVIENVPGAPLLYPALVCGLALGLRVKRHRLFESNVFLFGTTCPKGHKDEFLTVAGHHIESSHSRKRWVSVFGGGAQRMPHTNRRCNTDDAREAMGIDWMTRAELSQAIPPAYTDFIGRQLLRVVTA